MTRGRELTDRGKTILQLMHAHIAQRLEKELKKWEGKTDSQSRSKAKDAREKYILKNILNKGSASTSGIAVATHIAKGIHPDLSIKRATNLNIQPNELPARNEVGSHLLPPKESLADTTGNGALNSAAYELYLLLDLKFEGKSLSSRIYEEDHDVIKAFAEGAANENHGDVPAQKYNELMAEKLSHPATDTRAKQLYWLVRENPVKDDSYHLLAPLYATALTQSFYAQVNLSTWFFGEQNKAARKALRDRTAFAGGYVSYPNLAIQKFGGTKPQNISQLNSERRGENYLLASLPPNWKSREIYAPMRDALRAFKRRPIVWQTVNELKRFLETDPAPNIHTRDYRDDLTTMLVDELMLFTFDMHSLTPGWTADEKCRLPPVEQYWLDPGRVAIDAEFDEARRQSNWHEGISERVANWLNRELNHEGHLRFGDAEHTHWAKQIEGVMTQFRRQLDDLQDALRDENDEGEAA